MHLIWDTWSKDPVEATVLQAIFTCQIRVRDRSFDWSISTALGQHRVCFLYSLEMEELFY
jgi:hypothetical protein